MKETCLLGGVEEPSSADTEILVDEEGIKKGCYSCLRSKSGIRNFCTC